MSDRLSPDVVQFVNDTADSIERLDLLIVLIESPDRWWDAIAAGHATGVDPAMTERGLEHLTTRNLIAAILGATVSYRYEPGNATVRATSEAFAAAYRTPAIALMQSMCAAIAMTVGPLFLSF